MLRPESLYVRLEANSNSIGFIPLRFETTKSENRNVNLQICKFLRRHYGRGVLTQANRGVFAIGVAGAEGCDDAIIAMSLDGIAVGRNSGGKRVCGYPIIS